MSLEVTVVTTPFNGHQVSFFSENRESGFAGYRLYTQNTRETTINQQLEEFSSNRNFTRDTGWCPLPQGNLNFLQRFLIQVSSDELTNGFSCRVADLKLQSGFYLAVRSGVNRDCREIQSDHCFPWSGATVIQIP